jgi:uncharacterized protein YceK
MRFSVLALTALLATPLTGCGSIMHGTTQGVGLASSPTNAKITIDNVAKGNTPVITELTRKDTHIIKLELAGFMPYETTITRKVSGWVWGNIVFGGLVGLAVDAISGGLYELSPSEVNAALAKQSASAVSKPGTVNVFVVMQVDPSWTKVGQLSRE